MLHPNMGSMTKRPSRHLLPIPSVIFKSKSKLDLQHSATLHDISEQPDEDLTALPAPAITTAIDSQAPNKKSLWRRFLDKLKKLKKSKGAEEPLFAIGEPTDFRHVLSGTRDGIGTSEDFVKAFGLAACERFRVGPFARERPTSESEWTDIE